MSEDLVKWLRAQLDEDERLAAACEGDAVADWVVGDIQENGEPDVGLHLGNWLPTRVLAEVAAKRQLLEGHDGIHRCLDSGFAGGTTGPNDVTGPCQLAEILAAPYRARLTTVD